LKPLQRILLILICLLPLTVWPQVKDALDVNGLLKTDGQSLLSAAISEISMLDGGYFTMGTTSGASSLAVDDNLPLLFGHPYAKTSYPEIYLNGGWQKAEALFPTGGQVTTTGNCLEYRNRLENQLEFIFACESHDQGRTWKMTLEIGNLSASTLETGLGLVVDPAMGWRGDGLCRIDGGEIGGEREIAPAAAADSLEILQKAGLAHGMGLTCRFGQDSPAAIQIANWNTIYQNQTPAGRMIYDLCLRISSQVATLSAGESERLEWEWFFQDGEFANKLFLSAQSPRFLSIENNLLYPGQITAYLQLCGLSAQALNGTISIRTEEPLLTPDSNLTFSLSANAADILPITLESEERYEDSYSQVTIACNSGGTLLDFLSLPVFIPAVPVADTGLTVSIDSIDVSSYPTVRFVIDALQNTNQTRIKNIKPYHLTLYENDTRIQDIDLETVYSGSSLIDVVFVIDVSGSMGDNINQVRNNLNEFAQTLSDNQYNFRIGLVTFSDYVDHTWDLTSDTEAIRTALAGISLWGGDENSLAGLYSAAQLSWREGSDRSIIWITDEGYHFRDYSIEQITNLMLQKGIVVHSISDPSLQISWCNPVIEPTGGKFYSIFGNFRDILLDIASLRPTMQQIAYTSPSLATGGNRITLKIHYAGLGGQDTASYTVPGTCSSVPGDGFDAVCYPNPFNSRLRITLPASAAASEYQLAVYDIQGRQVFSQRWNPAQTGAALEWDARERNGSTLPTGVYFLALDQIASGSHSQRRLTRKIMLIK